MKGYLAGVFGVLLVFGLTIGLSAQEAQETEEAEETDYTGISDSTDQNDVLAVNPDLNLFPDEGASTEIEIAVYQDFTTGQRVGAGFGNFVLGLGSYIMGDWRGGLWGTLFDIVTIPLGILGISLLTSIDGKWIPFWVPFSNAGKVGGDLASLYVLGAILVSPIWLAYTAIWTLPYASIGAYAGNVVYKFVRPFKYHKPAPQTARLDDLRNWTVALVPDENGSLNGILAFTAHF